MSTLIYALSFSITLSFLIPVLITKTSMKLISLSKSPFECGFTSFKESQNFIALPFFNLALLFLILDVELILILPFTLTKNAGLTIFEISSVLTLFIFLTFGLFHEWSNTLLEWNK